jgi:GTP-binding protein
VHVVDGAARDPEWAYQVIRGELEAHDPALLRKPTLVVLNKLDLPAAADAWPGFRREREREGVRAIAISAASGEGIDAFRAAIATLLPGEAEAAAEPAGVVVHRLDPARDQVSVSRERDGAFRVAGRRIERIAAQTNFEIEESAERFQRDLERLGADAELRRAGVRPGDVVRVGAVELEWEAEPWAARR